MNETTRLDLDKQLKHQEKMKKQARLSDFVVKHFLVILLVCVLLPFVLMFADMILLSVLLFLVLYFGTIPFCIYVFITRFRHNKADSTLRQIVAAEIIPSILEESFEQAEYKAEETIPPEEIRETGIWSNHDMEGIHGNDYIKGIYKGLAFKMCNAHIGYSERTYDPEDQSYKNTYHKVFDGQWIILQTSLKPASSIVVAANTSRTSLFKNPVETEHIAFNERFEAAGNPTVVFEIITPPMMERLLAADAINSEAVNLRFMPDGRVGVALKNSENLFEVTGKSFKDTDLLCQKLRNDLKIITDVIDALGFND